VLEVVDEVRRWKWSWRRNLFLWDEEKVRQLEVLLVNVSLSQERDGWIWLSNQEDSFSVKSAFDLLREYKDDSNLSDFEEMICSRIWESSAPSKIVAFSWQLLLNRLPTKDNLRVRGVLPHDSGDNCEWCDHSPESASHLFLFCKKAHLVWYEVFKWLGVVIVMPPNIMILFDCILNSAKNKRLRKGFCFVWHTVVWSLWCARNNDIFNNIKVEPSEILEEIKVLSWKWSMDRLKIFPCLYYEWIWDPGVCFLR
jgi:hypothetical protein